MKPTTPRMRLTEAGGSVYLRYFDPYRDEHVTHEFRVATRGSNVREMGGGGAGSTVCRGLASTGPVLTATPETLLEISRREYQRSRRKERAEERA